MTAERGDQDEAASASRFEVSDEQAYFRHVEEVFVKLRGAPLLLSPKDWQLVRSWHAERIPLELIERTLVAQFEARRERGSTNTVSSLRYFKRAIEKVWEEVRQLTQDVAQRRQVEPLPLDERLAELASRLPSDVPEAQALRSRIESLRGPSDVVENALEALDRELLAKLRKGLDQGVRQELDDLVEKRMGKLRARLPPEQLEGARRRLFDRLLRERMSLPVLSLFASE